MNRKTRIHDLLRSMSDELLAFIREKEVVFKEGWVPSTYIKKELDLNFVCVPRNNKQYGEKGWLLAILARLLEDRELVEHVKVGNRAYFRSARN